MCLIRSANIGSRDGYSLTTVFDSRPKQDKVASGGFESKRNFMTFFSTAILSMLLSGYDFIHRFACAFQFQISSPWLKGFTIDLRIFKVSLVFQEPVVQKANNSINPINRHLVDTVLVSLQFIRWIAIYPVENWVQEERGPYLVLGFAQLDFSDFTRNIGRRVSLRLLRTESDGHIFGTVRLQVSCAGRERDFGWRRPRETDWIRGGVVCQSE